MAWFPTINSNSKINFVQKTSAYANPGTGDGSVGYVLGRDDTCYYSPKNLVAVTSYGHSKENPFPVGTSVVHEVQGINGSRRVYRKVVGYVDAQGRIFGQVPNKPLVHYVMK